MSGTRRRECPARDASAVRRPCISHLPRGEDLRTFRAVALGRDASVTGSPSRNCFASSRDLRRAGRRGREAPLGRWFSRADDTPGSAETVMLTYGYWQRRFGGDTSIVGRTLTIESRPRTVIGVMPEDFRFRAIPS